jgi:siroheme synthase (precorrin-2 oxidase/ferrochelatase)
MESLVLLVALAVVVGCGAAYLSLRRIRHISKVKPLLGVVAPEKPQDALQSIKTNRKVK